MMILGVEIGGTKLQFGVCTADGRVVALRRVAVDRAGGRRGIMRQMSAEVRALVAEHKVGRIGVGFGGPVDVGRGCVIKSHQVAGWSGFALRNWFVKEFGLPTMVENDSNCAALAEAVRGAGKGKRVVFYFNVGTGIGGGLVIAGQLYNGRYGALELGHTRLSRFPEFRFSRERSSPRKTELVTVEAVAAGLAIERGVSTVTQAARYLGVAVANAITLLNPDIVVVGGGVSLAGRRFWGPLRVTARELVFPPFRNNFEIVPAALGEQVVVVGAALVASSTGVSPVCAARQHHGRDARATTAKAWRG
jgi:glucokinase